MANPVARGVIGTILVGKETSYGTGGTPAKDIGLIMGGSRGADSPIAESFGYGQASSISVNPNIVNPRGSFDVELQHGRMLEYALFGGTTTHVETTGDWVHTMVWSNSLPSFAAEGSYELGATDLSGVYTGLIFTNSTLSLGVDGRLKMRSDWVASNINNNSTTATAAVVNTGAPLRGFSGGFSIGGSSASYVQNWELGVNRNSKTIHGQGTRAAPYGASHNANITWKATIGFSSTTEINRLLGSTSAITTTAPTAFSIILTADNGTALGSGKRAISCTLGSCQVKDFTENYALNDFVMYDISGSGILGATTFTDQVSDVTW